MWPSDYFASSYWAPSYWAGDGEGAEPGTLVIVQVVRPLLFTQEVGPGDGGAVYLGSRVRVVFDFVTQDEDGAISQIDLDDVVTKTVRIVKPDGEEVESPELVIAGDGSTAYWEGIVDQKDVWYVQGTADGYISAPATFRVRANP